MASEGDDVLRTQIEYYRARAGEYDDWFLRRGRYDRGPEENAAWFRDVAALQGIVDAWVPRGHVLEPAAGTGLWTERLAARAARVTAVDASPEVLALNRERLGVLQRESASATAPAPVEYVQADLFTWRPTRRYDGVFLGFWLSHVPPERFDAFWAMVRGAVAEGGSVCFVDSLYDPTSTARDHRLEGEDATRVSRRLDDGRTFRIVKVFYDPDAMTERLAGLGWRVTVGRTERYFLWGRGEPVTA